MSQLEFGIINIPNIIRLARAQYLTLVIHNKNIAENIILLGIVKIATTISCWNVSEKMANKMLSQQKKECFISIFLNVRFM